MKKIITLLLLAGAVSGTAFSQTPQEESRRVILGKGGSTGSSDPRDVILGRDGRNNETGYPSGTRDQQVNQINREYDAKIQSIRNNPNLSAAEKERMIRQLEIDRQRKINEVNRRYNDGDRKRGDRDRDDDDRDDKKYGKNNNGKKLGWEKGVGNPHRTGSDKDFGYNKNNQNKKNGNYSTNNKAQTKGKSKPGKGKKN